MWVLQKAKIIIDNEKCYDTKAVINTDNKLDIAAILKDTVVLRSVIIKMIIEWRKCFRNYRHIWMNLSFFYIFFVQQ